MDVPALFVSFVVGSIGFVLFYYGRRMTRLPQLTAGLLLMVYPYFVPNIFVTIGIALALLAAMWLAIRAGI